MLVTTLGTFRNQCKITEIRGILGQSGMDILSIKSNIYYGLGKVPSGNFLGFFGLPKSLIKFILDFSFELCKLVIWVPLMPRLHRLPYYPNF
jgi:hypothetical protein